MKKALAAVVAAGVLVAGAFVAGAVGPSGSAVAQEADESPTAPEAQRPERGQIMQEVLDGLVSDGVISEAQADQIAAAFQEKFAEVREELGDRPLRRHAFRKGFRAGALLDDGVIDAEELAELPENHPLNDPQGPAAPYLDDGQLTIEELREIRRQLHEDRTGADAAQSSLTF